MQRKSAFRSAPPKVLLVEYKAWPALLGSFENLLFEQIITDQIFYLIHVVAQIAEFKQHLYVCIYALTEWQPRGSCWINNVLYEEQLGSLIVGKNTNYNDCNPQMWLGKC